MNGQFVLSARSTALQGHITAGGWGWVMWDHCGGWGWDHELMMELGGSTVVGGAGSLQVGGDGITN